MRIEVPAGHASSYLSAHLSAPPVPHATAPPGYSTLLIVVTHIVYTVMFCFTITSDLSVIRFTMFSSSSPLSASDRSINVPLCMGLPLRSRRRAA